MRRLFHLKKTCLEPKNKINYLTVCLEKGKMYTDPDFLSKISAHHQLGDAARWSKGQSIVSPFLTEIEIGREVLESGQASCDVFLCCVCVHVPVNHKASDDAPFGVHGAPVMVANDAT